MICRATNFLLLIWLIYISLGRNVVTLPQGEGLSSALPCWGLQRGTLRSEELKSKEVKKNGIYAE